MHNIQERATLINALKYVLLIFAVPWLAYAVSMCIFTAVIFLTDKLGIPCAGIPALLLIAALYAAFTALILRGGIFLLRAMYTQKYFMASCVGAYLMLPVVLYTMVLCSYR